MSIPPTNPIFPVFDAIAAAMPTRKEPSCSLKTIDWTLQVHDRVDDGELEIRELPGHSLRAACLGEPDPDDDLRPTPRHVAQRLLALGLVRHLELAIRDGRLLLEAFGAGVRGLVEGLVELSPHVEHDRRDELLGRDVAGRSRHGGDQDGHDERCRISHGPMI